MDSRGEFCRDEGCFAAFFRDLAGTFRFGGREDRRHCCRAMFGSFFVGFLAGLAWLTYDYFFGKLISGESLTGALICYPLLGVVITYLVFLVFATPAMLARRLRDRGKSPSWAVLALLLLPLMGLPYLLFFFWAMGEDGDSVP